MLTLKDVDAGYGKLNILRGVSLQVEEGEFVALLGSNGVGKTTILRTIAGIVKPSQGEISFMGNRIDNLPVQLVTKAGVCFITDDGCLFSGMTVRENLLLGAYTIREKIRIKSLLDRSFELFPRLKERKNQISGTLSGGERKMLAIARGLMSDPKMMLVDEPSMGLAPQLVLSVFQKLKELNTMGVTILLVEQNVNTTLQIVDRGYVIEQGHIVMSGDSGELRNNEHIQKSYMGID